MLFNIFLKNKEAVRLISLMEVLEIQDGGLF